MSPAIKTRTKQHFPDSDTLFFLTIQCIHNAQLYLQEHPKDHSTTINTAVLGEHPKVSGKFGASSK